MLSQAETAIEVGFSKTSGFKYVSWLEIGRIKNPSLLTILRYLKACQVPLANFFQELTEIDFTIKHENIMRQVEIPSNITPHLRRKISRDTAKYVTKIQYPKTSFPKLDRERIKDKIDKKVNILLKNHLLEETQKIPYFNFVNELTANYDSGQASAIYEKSYKTRGSYQGAISVIRNIVYQTLRREDKRLVKPNPLTQEKLHKIAKGFIKHRVKIEQIEAETQKLLG